MQRRTKIYGAMGGAAVLVVVGVGAATGSGSPATSGGVLMAEPTPTSTATAYPGTVATSVSVQGRSSVKQGKRQSLTIEVQVAGNAEPQGELTVTVARAAGGASSSYSATYTGEPVKIRTEALKRTGRHVATASFDAPDDSVFQDSSGTFTFQVVAKPKGGGKNGKNGN